MGTPKGTKPWNAGTSAGWTDKRGYRWIYVNENGRRRARREHRHIMEQALGRSLEPWELVHHKDGNRANNAADNLELTTFDAHTVGHSTGREHSEQSKRSMEAFANLREEIRHLRRVNADLLAALEECIEALDGIAFRYPDVGTSSGFFYADQYARAAIAKARGEE